MAGNQVTVIVRIRAKPETRAEVKQALLSLLSPTRSEEGCLNYDMHQAPDDDSLFLFHENWTSEEALKKHLQAAHVRKWIDRADELLAEPMELTLWHKSD